MKRPLFAALVAILGLTLSGCDISGGRTPARPGSAAPAAISIAAAADLRYALEELVRAFKVDQPDAVVSISYGSSGSYYAQLLNGAPFDIFLSADVAYPRELARRGLTATDGEFVYAEGRIAVWAATSLPLDVGALGFTVLTHDAVKRVAIANPEHAPYGRAAQAAMRSVGIFDAVAPKLVYGENVSQTLQFVQSGAADAGIVALSLAVAPAVASAGRYWVIPPDLHPRIEQGGTIMRTAANPQLAYAFRRFMLGDEARAVLTRYGFSLPATGAGQARGL